MVFLHGFGSTKEDYLDVACQHAFTGRPFLAYDAPGCGETCCDDLASISIPFLVKTAQAVLDHAGIRRFHLVGHSMGGLTALLLAHQEPDRVLSFIDIEGNLAPEDCFLSRQILTHPSPDDNGFLDDLTERARRSPSASSALYAASLRHKVRPGAVRGIFQSMVLPGQTERRRRRARSDPAQRTLADVRQPRRDVGTDRRVHPPAMKSDFSHGNTARIRLILHGGVPPVHQGRRRGGTLRGHGPHRLLDCRPRLAGRPARAPGLKKLLAGISWLALSPAT